MGPTVCTGSQCAGHAVGRCDPARILLGGEADAPHLVRAKSPFVGRLVPKKIKVRASLRPAAVRPCSRYFVYVMIFRTCLGQSIRLARLIHSPHMQHKLLYYYEK